MRAITVLPGIANSARLDEMPEPPPSDGAVLVRTLALGVCATDREILTGAYGTRLPARGAWYSAMSCWARWISAPPDCGVAPGDLVVGIVRRPDPQPCPACAAGEWDMCRNGRYTERGIKERHGYGAERFRVEPSSSSRSIRPWATWGPAGAGQHPGQGVGSHRAHRPACPVVGAAKPAGHRSGPGRPPRGSDGQQRGLDVHVLDHNKGGPKEAIVRDLGAAYHSDPNTTSTSRPRRADGMHGGAGRDPRLPWPHVAPAGIVCLTGVTGPGKTFELDIGRPQPQDGARQRNRIRHGECQPPSLRDGGGRSGACRQDLARAIDHAPRSARLLERGARAAQGDIKVVIDLLSRPSCRFPSRTTP